MPDTGHVQATAHRRATRSTPDRGITEVLCDLVTVPARQGLEAVDILRLRTGVGPVLHDGEGDTLGFVVPPGTAEVWDLPGSSCVPARRISCGAGRPTATGSGWLVPPGSAVTGATAPGELCAALTEAARTLEAVDRCAQST
ncbi:hypothetical protein PJ985_18735 [Streptomyces sp. ACA25]|uniref:hypothetical protein n=1 Tax=Streptomyces sp. ACA25 TaxID=3022596 RepID=UPI002307C211|nr:hypothetical protein [Streptomyces sp. ACA25]MDB1089598.1 hypothetical protein [Streptomyces sp. ACA25]